MSSYTVIPATPGYKVLHKNTWREVLAWGFDAYGNGPEPFCIYGKVASPDFEGVRVAQPNGEIVSI